MITFIKMLLETFVTLNHICIQAAGTYKTKIVDLDMKHY